MEKDALPMVKFDIIIIIIIIISYQALCKDIHHFEKFLWFKNFETPTKKKLKYDMTKSSHQRKWSSEH